MASNEVSLRTSDGSLVLAEAIGNVRIYFHNYRFLLLKDVFFVPNFKQNLISVACLLKDSYSASFGQIAVIRKNNIFVCSGEMISNLYFIKPISHMLNNTELNNSNKRESSSNSNESYLWHLGLGHIGQ